MSVIKTRNLDDLPVHTCHSNSICKSNPTMTGRSWVRFEKSQQKEDIGKRVVMLRVLELGELVQLGIEDEAHPVHTPPYGSFVMVTTQRGFRRPFRAHVDKSQLRLLWVVAGFITERNCRAEPALTIIGCRQC